MKLAIPQSELAAIGATRAPVYRQYPLEHKPQPAYIELDLQHDTIRVDYDGEVGNGGTPMPVYLGRRRRIDINPYARGRTIVAFLESPDTRALLERIEAGYSEDYDRQANLRGYLTDDAQEAFDELQRLAENAFSDPEAQATIYNIADYLQNTIARQPAEEPTSIIIGGIGTITAVTTDEAIQRMALTVNELAEADDIELEQDARDYLSELREEVQTNAKEADA